MVPTHGCWVIWEERRRRWDGQNIETKLILMTVIHLAKIDALSQNSLPAHVIDDFWCTYSFFCAGTRHTWSYTLRLSEIYHSMINEAVICNELLNSDEIMDNLRTEHRRTSIKPFKEIRVWKLWAGGRRIPEENKVIPDRGIFCMEILTSTRLPWGKHLAVSSVHTGCWSKLFLQKLFSGFLPADLQYGIIMRGPTREGKLTLTTSFLYRFIKIFRKYVCEQCEFFRLKNSTPPDSARSSYEWTPFGKSFMLPTWCESCFRYIVLVVETITFLQSLHLFTYYTC